MNALIVKPTSLNALTGGLLTGRIGSAPKLKVVKEATPLAPEKPTIYDNFTREINKRLKTDPSKDATILSQSLTGAMGEVERLFGRDAAILTMAKILNGTENQLDLDSLVAALENSFASLKLVDPTGAAMDGLLASLNADLALAVDSKALETKLNNHETLSLSLALSQYFGGESKVVSQKPVATDDEAPNQASAQLSGSKAIFTTGFTKEAKWSEVTFSAAEAKAESELKERAESELKTAGDLSLTTLIKKGGAEDVFNDLVHFLENLDQKEAAEYLSEGLKKALADDGLTKTSPLNVSQVLNQIYSQVATTGDAESLALFEDYVNSDFKNAFNAALENLQKMDDSPFNGNLNLGLIQFKGLTGTSLAGENDNFSLVWGYQNNGQYDLALTKRVLQEDLSDLNLSLEKKEKTAKNAAADLLTNSETGAINQDSLSQGQSAKEESVKEKGKASQAESQRSNKLTAALDLKFGQLTDNVNAELSRYVKDNLNEDLAEEALAQTKWSHNLMKGLAAIKETLATAGVGTAKIKDFLGFINGHLKNEVDNLLSRLEGVSFLGWETDASLTEGLTATFGFKEAAETTSIVVMGPTDLKEERQAETLITKASTLAGSRAYGSSKGHKAKNLGLLLNFTG
ncbi:MAG: hypothetical protein LBI10_04980 [Deltaproteobacteria bacterium]|jgi:hypothetical protein|nr:hypothetical protein [Deltaproteobacteria bacterium]